METIEKQTEVNMTLDWSKSKKAESNLIEILKKCEANVTINISGITRKAYLRGFVSMVNRAILLPDKIYKQIIDEEKLTYTIITKN